MQSEEENSTKRGESIGLCRLCRFSRKQVTTRGSVFFRCSRSDEDDRYPRYPPLPVQQCQGHEPG